MYNLHTQTYHYNNLSIQILVPEQAAIQQQYIQHHDSANDTNKQTIIHPQAVQFPSLEGCPKGGVGWTGMRPSPLLGGVPEGRGGLYFARIWPASIALCQFLAANTQLIKGKLVAEIAAGLGLPSLLAAHYAKEVSASDYHPQAIQIIAQSAALNQLNNIQTTLLNWTNIPDTFSPQVLLLSDVNYSPEAFLILQQLIQNLMNKGTLIILSTPQRLVAKSFLLPLLPYCIQQENYTIQHEGISTETSVFVLSK